MAEFTYALMQSAFHLGVITVITCAAAFTVYLTLITVFEWRPWE